VSDNYDNDFDYDDERKGPAPSREQAKKLQKQLDELRKQLDAEKAEKTELAAKVKKSSLADLLKQAGVDPKFAARADKDGADATEDGVKAWIDENKDFYNFGAAKPAETVVEQVEQDGEPNVSAGLEAAVRASQALSESGVAPSEIDIIQKIQSVPTEGLSEGDFLARLGALGVGIN
jgi:hypothetical protein